VSRACRALVHLLLPPSRPLQDPLSGLFALRRSVLEGVHLQPSGYKILLEVVVRARPSSVRNVGFDFAPRQAGRSKASFHEGLVFLRHLCRLLVATPHRYQGSSQASVEAPLAPPNRPDKNGAEARAGTDVETGPAIETGAGNGTEVGAGADVKSRAGLETGTDLESGTDVGTSTDIGHGAEQPR
jgi:hypothetical protein